MVRSLLVWMVVVVVAGIGPGCGTPHTPSDDSWGVDAEHDLPSQDDEVDAPEVVPTDTEAPLLDQPMDLIPFARLEASATAPNSIFPWPREAEDAIATIRDDDPGTTWKVPVGAPALVVIDLQPWLGRPVSLSHMVFEVTSGVLTEIEVSLAPGCGSLPSANLLWVDPSVPLELDDRYAGCVTIEVHAEAPTSVGGIALYSRDGSVTLPGEPWTDASPEPPEWPSCGVVEGFYGVPWSWPERHAMIWALAELGMGTYLYAPKHDPLHRAEWRVPYPAETMARFASLAATGSAVGVDMLVGVSPFVDFDFGAATDYEILRDKLQGFVDVGIQGMALLADDIEIDGALVVDGVLGQQHVAIANQLLDDLVPDGGELRFWFVPTAYSDARADGWEEGWSYVEALQGLDPSVEVMWTGTDTFSPTLAAADLGKVTAAIGRPPLVWDNFWANDGGDGFMGRVLSGPYTGRGGDLSGAVTGIIQNPMIQGGLSRLALGTFAAWLETPSAAPDPTDAFLFATSHVPLSLDGGSLPGEESELATAVAALFQGNTAIMPGSAALAFHTSKLLELLAATPLDTSAVGDEVAALLPLLVTMIGAPSEVHHGSLAPDVVDELAFPLAKARALGELGLWTLAALGRSMAGLSPTEALTKAQEARALAEVNRFVLSPDVLEPLLNVVTGMPVAEAGVVPLVPVSALPETITVAERLTWSPFPGAAAAHVAGLPGATFEGDTLTWEPDHAGWYQGVLAAWVDDPPGWGIALVGVVVEEGP